MSKESAYIFGGCLWNILILEFSILQMSLYSKALEYFTHVVGIKVWLDVKVFFFFGLDVKVFFFFLAFSESIMWI